MGYPIGITTKHVVRSFGVAALIVAMILAPASARPVAQSVDLRAADAHLRGEAAGDLTGTNVQTGDLDGDGIEDVLIGGYGDQTGGRYSGAVYILYGPVRGRVALARADAKLVGSLPGDFVGEERVAISDLDGDGVHDLIVGAPGSIPGLQPGPPKPGDAFVLYGGKRLSGTITLEAAADARIIGIHTTDFLGYGAAGVGDVDGDGLDDAVIGAAGTAGQGGAAYLLHGGERMTGLVSALHLDAYVCCGAPFEYVAERVTAGDLDDDGFSDIILGGSANKAYVFYGGERRKGFHSLADADAILVGAPGDELGLSLDAEADVTGDRKNDIVLGAPGKSTVYVLAGGKRLQGTVDVLATARTRIVGTGSLGTGVATGDVDRDRRADVVAGAPSTGVAYVFRGPLKKGRLSPTNAATRLVGKTGEGLGADIAIGNVGGNRARDILIGAPTAEKGTGLVYVIFGPR